MLNCTRVIFFIPRHILWKSSQIFGSHFVFPLQNNFPKHAKYIKRTQIWCTYVKLKKKTPRENFSHIHIYLAVCDVDENMCNILTGYISVVFKISRENTYFTPVWRKCRAPLVFKEYFELCCPLWRVHSPRSKFTVICVLLT